MVFLELIILGLAGAVSVFGTTVFVKKQKREKEAHYQIEKIEILDFVQSVLTDRVVFRKISASGGFLRTRFQASNQGFLLDVIVTNHEIEFILHSTNKSYRRYYHYVFNRDVQSGQIMDDSQQDFVSTNEPLLRQLDEKITEYGWENPLSFYAKKTFDAFGGKKSVQKPKTTKQQSAPFYHELQQEIDALETLYVEIKQVAETHFDVEEKHQLERLFHQDLHRLKETFLLIQVKTPEDIRQMRESLAIIENQLRAFYIKAEMHHKQSFERAVEIIKYRNENN